MLKVLFVAVGLLLAGCSPSAEQEQEAARAPAEAPVQGAKIGDWGLICRTGIPVLHPVMTFSDTPTVPGCSAMSYRRINPATAASWRCMNSLRNGFRH